MTLKPPHKSHCAPLQAGTSSTYIIALLCWRKKVIQWSFICRGLNHFCTIYHLLSSPTTSLYPSLPLCTFLQRCWLLSTPQMSLVHSGHLRWNACLPTKVPTTDHYMASSFWLIEKNVSLNVSPIGKFPLYMQRKVVFHPWVTLILLCFIFFIVCITIWSCIISYLIIISVPQNEI